ncbi:ethionine resistance protein [Coemansia sp. IMI 203386]|nr:ethionine resistance protein [Coemansia sp. IMI 203386]
MQVFQGGYSADDGDQAAVPLVTDGQRRNSDTEDHSHVSADYRALSVSEVADIHNEELLDIPFSEIFTPQRLKSEGLLLVRSSMPIVLSSMSQLLLMIPLMAAVGRLGTIALASMNLVSIYAGLCGVAPILGFPMALDSLCSQAYTAATDRKLLGVYLQRVLVVGFIFEAAMYPLWWYSRAVYEYLGIPADIAETTSSVLRLYFFGMLLLLVYECLKSYLFAQGIRRIAVISQIIVLPVGWLAVWLLIANTSTSLGILGIPSVIIIVFMGFTAVAIVFIAKVDGAQCWGGWSRAAFMDLGHVVKLAFAGSAIAVFESIALHTIDIGVLFMDAPTMAAQAILNTMLVSIYMIGTGFAVAVCNRVGNLLGLGQPNRALLAVHTMVFIASSLFVILGVTLISHREQMARMFTPDPEIADILIAHIPWMVVCSVIQGINMAFNGIMRGQGRQTLIARIRILSFICVCIPFSAAGVMLFNWGLAGLWFGYLSSISCTLLCQIYMVATTDWEKEIERCRRRVSNSMLAYSAGQTNQLG